jgi:phosphoribosylaminoimidazole-succinocarboxamide synthase
MSTFCDIHLPLEDRREGKVRVSYRIAPAADGTPRRLFVTTDRVSAFDRIIAGIPHKGQVLNQLAAWWFAATADIVPNQLLGTPDPNVTIARDASPLPVEVVVRGAITGITSTSLWKQYDDGARTIYGYHFPDGLRKNTMLPEPIVTPTTKPPAGTDRHDEPLTWADVVDRRLVDAERWERITAAALEVFRRGQERAADAGLILADTKYEFGLDAAGEVMLIDEVHTPDSSRYWVAETYESRQAAGDEPESLDKEPLRIALSAAGYRGEGDPPVLAPDVIDAASARYIDAYERLTGLRFVPGTYPVGERIAANLDLIIA